MYFTNTLSSLLILGERLPDGKVQPQWTLKAACA
jgi:hypothetical protein